MGPREMLLQVSFNQDAGCFAASTTTGFRVYNCGPFCELLRRDLVEFWSGHAAGGGVGAVEMLFRTNVLALIGGGGDPEASKAAVIWDDHKGRCLALLPGGGSCSAEPVSTACTWSLSASPASPSTASTT